MTRIEGDAMDWNAIHVFMLKRNNLISRIEFAAGIVRKSSQNLNFMPAFPQSLRKRKTLEKWLRLKPLGQE